MDTKKEVDSNETTKIRMIQKEILQVMEKNEITYDEAEKILSGLAQAIKDLAIKQMLKNPF